jgi:hypothetical protein
MDPRCKTNLKYLKERYRDVYFTPHFLEFFDFEETDDRNFLKAKVRF